MRKLTISEREKLGIPSYQVESVAKERSRGMVNYIVMMVALARDKGMSPRDLVEWVHEHFEERGYFDETLFQYGPGNNELFLQEFVVGRQLLYDHSDVFLLEDGSYEVQTASWMTTEQSEVFFYFDMELDDFVEYAEILAKTKAERLGITLQLTHENGIERAVIRSRQD